MAAIAPVRQEIAQTLVGLKDRVEALGGRIMLESERGRGTALSVELPRAST